METYVRLKIGSNNKTPDEISNTLGIKSDRSWVVGDLRPHTIIKEKSNGWVLNSRLDKTTSLETQISDLFQQIGSRTHVIRDMSRSNSVEISCVIYSSGAPPLYFDRSVIEQIHDIGGNLDIDLHEIRING